MPAAECSVTAVVWPHTISVLSPPCAIYVRTAATGASKGAHALLHPQVNNILSAFTENSLWNQIHLVAQQIIGRRPPTPVQGSHILATVLSPSLHNHNHLSKLSIRNRS